MSLLYDGIKEVDQFYDSVVEDVIANLGQVFENAKEEERKYLDKRRKTPKSKTKDQRSYVDLFQPEVAVADLRHAWFRHLKPKKKSSETATEPRPKSDTGSDVETKPLEKSIKAGNVFDLEQKSRKKGNLETTSEPKSKPGIIKPEASEPRTRKKVIISETTSERKRRESVEVETKSDVKKSEASGSNSKKEPDNKKAKQRNFKQQDGADSDSSAEEEDETKDVAKDDAADSDPLCSADDFSDDPDELFRAEDLVHCKFEDVSREKGGKWRLRLKEGVANFGGKEIIFNECNSELIDFY